jgi:hypothetical protein
MYLPLFSGDRQSFNQILLFMNTIRTATAASFMRTDGIGGQLWAGSGIPNSRQKF